MRTCVRSVVVEGRRAKNLLAQHRVLKPPRVCAVVVLKERENTSAYVGIRQQTSA